MKTITDFVDADGSDVGPLNEYGSSWRGREGELLTVTRERLDTMKEMAVRLIELQKPQFEQRWGRYELAVDPDQWYLSGIADVSHGGQYRPAWQLECRPFEGKVFVCFNHFMNICDYQIC